MTAREQRLLTVTGVVVGCVVLFVIAKEAIIDPLNTVEDEKTGFKKTIRDNERKLADWNKYKRSLEALNPRIANWRKLSLPESDNPSERVRASRAFDTHLGWLRKGYQKYLTDLLVASGIDGGKINPIDKDKKTIAAGKAPPYRTLTFSVTEALGEQASIRKFITAFDKTPLLHQVRHFSIERQGGTTSKLKLTMTVEVLLVNDAEAVAARKDKSIMPGFGWEPVAEIVREMAPQMWRDLLAKSGATDLRPGFLALDTAAYAASDAKNMFAPKSDVVRNDTPPPDVEPPTPTVRGERAEDVLSYVRLTLITDSPYYNCRIARINNLGLRADATRGESVLLVDATLPTDSPYQLEKKEREKAAKDTKPVKPAPDPSPIPRNPKPAEETVDTSVRSGLPPLEEPARRWVIRDRFKETVLEFQVVKVDPLRIIIQADEKFYTVAVGDTLWDALESPLGNDELKKLNLLADKDEVLKTVKLAKLASNTDRNGDYEATFVNPDNKNEKVILATTVAGEELSAPDSWSVRDRFKAEAVKMTVVQLGKDGVIFAANKKYYRIKPDQTLFDALAKPLGEDEVKTLKLKAL